MSGARFVSAVVAVARRLPDVEEDVACKGTAVESRAFKTQKKTFLFLGKTTLRLKLKASLTEAKKLAKHSPERFDVGSSGWVKVTFEDQPPPVTLLRHWVTESHRLCSG